MSAGGGFCTKHGPFDPPHTVCPFCAREDPQRREFGPPVKPAYKPRQAPPRPPAPPADDSSPENGPPTGFQRATVEPGTDEQADDAQPTELAPPEASEDVTAVDMPRVIDEGALPLAWLVVKEPRERRGEVLNVRHGQIIGREGDIRWSDPRLSRQHARFTVEPLGETVGDQLSDTLVFHIWPFAPTNPVLINGEVVRAATPLRENDEIRLGDTLFVFKLLTD